MKKTTDRLITLQIFLLFCPPMYAQQLQPIGIFDHHQDIGQPKLDGYAVYNPADQTYIVSGGGVNMWANMDQFHFLWKKIKGDFIVRATIEFIGTGTDPHRKIGIIAREELTANSRYVDAAVHGDNLTALQYRKTSGEDTEHLELSVYHPTDIEFARKGDVFTFSAAVFGETYKSVHYQMDLDEEAYVGLIACSHRENVVESAMFRNVRIVIPASDDFVPYRDYIGSNLEIMDVETGHRKILHSAPNSLQAPNWTADNKYLIYAEEGLLNRYHLDDGMISTLNTGFANQNNNDHVISFDGKQMAISHYVGENRTSTLFTLPLEGSDQPTRITDPANGHSFLHSWTTDDRKLIYTANRGGQWDIWEIDIESKKERPLTSISTLDDGPEMSPDGAWIYFNSVRTGTMQIWKMRADGSQQQQITFDEYNDWFPHFSPDGSKIVYLSFPKEIDPTDHPFYKRVYIRIMPVEGGVPKTIAYVYGGQGTINVPSWSPDGKKIAFISNSKL